MTTLSTLIPVVPTSSPFLSESTASVQPHSAQIGALGDSATEANDAAVTELLALVGIGATPGTGTLSAEDNGANDLASDSNAGAGFDGPQMTSATSPPAEDDLTDGEQLQQLLVADDDEDEPELPPEDPATVTVTESNPAASEAGAIGSYTFERTGSTAGALTVTYTVGGTASADADYAALSGDITFATGESTVTVAVSPLDDSEDEDDETVAVELTASPGMGYMIGSPSSATVTIADDDEAPTVWIERVSDALEGGSAGSFRLWRDFTVNALTVGYQIDPSSTATNGIDFADMPGTYPGGNTGTVTFASGEASVDLIVDPTDEIHDDDVAEEDETVTVALEAGNGVYLVGALGIATLLVADNLEKPIVSIMATPNKVQTLESSGEKLSFTVTRIGNKSKELDVSYSVAEPHRLSLDGNAMHRKDYKELYPDTATTWTLGF